MMLADALGRFDFARQQRKLFRGRGSLRSIAKMAIVVSMLAQPALAEPETGSRVVPTKDLRSGFSGPQKALAVRNLMTCVVHRRRLLAEHLLAATKAEEIKSLNAQVFREIECNWLAGSADFTNQQYFNMPLDIRLGLLSEALLAEMAPNQPLPTLAPEKAYQRPWIGIAGRDPQVDQMGACVADIDPSGIEKLLATKAETPPEGAAISALSPSLGICLSKGMTLRANRESLRAVLAEALYQRRVSGDPTATADSHTQS